MKKAIWIFALVSLLFVGMLSVVEAPSGGDAWDIRYEVNNVLPENADPAWTRTTGGTTSRDPTMYHHQILNITMTGATGDLESYQYDFTENTDFVVFEARVNIPVAYPTTIRQNINLDIYMTDGSELSIQTWYNNRVYIYYPDKAGSTTSIQRWVGNYTTVNHTYTLIAYQEDGLSQMDFYFDYSFVGHVSSYTERDFKAVRWNCIDTTSETKYFEWDYVLVRNRNLLADLNDEINDLKKEIEDLRKKLDDIHSGEIISPTEKPLPYPPGTREGLDADYYLLGDPYRELFFNSYSDPDAASSVTLPIVYDTSWSDVDMLIDQLWIGDFAGTLYINDTTDSTKILQTTQSYSHFLVNDTSEGHALTVEVTSGSVKVSRMARTHATFTFDWYIDPHTYEHRTVFSVDNDLTENWREIVIVVAGNPDYTIDSSSVEVWDLDNNVELTTKNYEMTSTSFRMGLTWLNSSTSRSFKILYSPYQEGSSYQEPMGVFKYDVSSSATLNNRVFLFDSVAISNPNSIDCDVGTRITIQMSSIPGNINEIFVITDGGSYLTQGPPLGNKWYTFYGLEIPASSVVTVSVYVKAPEPTLSPGWFQLHGLWIFALFFIMLIISFLGWMWAVTVKGMKKYAGPIAAFFWFNVLMTMLFGVLTFLAGG